MVVVEGSIPPGQLLHLWSLVDDARERLGALGAVSPRAVVSVPPGGSFIAEYTASGKNPSVRLLSITPVH